MSRPAPLAGARRAAGMRPRRDDPFDRRARRAAMANLAEGIQGLVTHMRQEQQIFAIGSRRKPPSRRTSASSCAARERTRSALSVAEGALGSELSDGAVARTQLRSVNYWPGFVDALSTMLLAIIFLLSVFMLAQFFLSREVTGKDTALPAQPPDRGADQPARHGAFAKERRRRRRSPRFPRRSKTSQAERQRLLGEAVAGRRQRRRGERQGERGRQCARSAKADSPRALAQVDILNEQIAALRKQLTAIQQALDASQTSRQGGAGQDRRSRSAPQCRAGAEGAGTVALSLGFLRPPASDSRLAAGHPGRRRPLRVRILGAVRFAAKRTSATRGASRSTAWPPPCSISSAKSRPTSPGSCASTAIPTPRRSPAGNSIELGFVGGARDRGGGISRLQGHRARIASPPPASANSSRSTREPTIRRWRATAASN